MYSFALLGLLFGRSFGGNCGGRHCHPRSERIPAIQEEEQELRLHMNTHESLTHILPLTYADSDVVSREAALSHPDSSLDNVRSKDRLDAQERNSDAPDSPALPAHAEAIYAGSHGDSQISTTLSSCQSIQTGKKEFCCKQAISDCLEDHLAQKVASYSEVISPLRISPQYSVVEHESSVDYDTLYECHRVRRIIAWRPLEGMRSIMEYRRSFKYRQVPIGQALVITRNILDMVLALNQAGVVYGNLTPSNVGVLPDGSVGLMDLVRLVRVRNLSKSQCMLCVFQILIDMNPSLYMQLMGDRIRGMHVLKQLQALRDILMNEYSTAQYHSARDVLDSLISLKI